MTHYPDHATDYEARYYWKDDVLSHLDGHPLAGGEAYVQSADVPTRSDADVIATTASDVFDAAESSSQQTVWVDEPIDLGDTRGQTARNVTIAGDRGQGGTTQSLLYSDVSGYPMPRHFECEGDVRFTGLEIRGPSYDVWDNAEYPGWVPNWDGRYDDYGAEFADLDGDGIEVDNCEIHGWGTQAFRVYSSSPEIHHNYIHDNMMTSLGYAFTVYHGSAHAHHNFFDAHRHAINGFGYHDAGYTVEDNVFGPSASAHQIDMHALDNNRDGSDLSSDPDDELYRYRGGGDCVIRRNTFLYTNVIHGPDMPAHPTGFDRGRWHWVYSNRGIPHPGTSVEIYENRLMHHGPQSGNPGEGSGVRNLTEDAFVQATHGHSTNAQGFARVEHSDNQYDAVNTPYEQGYGAPVNVEGAIPGAGRGLDGYRYPRERLAEIQAVLDNA